MHGFYFVDFLGRDCLHPREGGLQEVEVQVQVEIEVRLRTSSFMMFSFLIWLEQTLSPIQITESSLPMNFKRPMKHHV